MHLSHYLSNNIPVLPAESFRNEENTDTDASLLPAAYSGWMWWSDWNVSVPLSWRQMQTLLEQFIWSNGILTGFKSQFWQLKDSAKAFYIQAERQLLSYCVVALRLRLLHATQSSQEYHLNWRIFKVLLRPFFSVIVSKFSVTTTSPLKPNKHVVHISSLIKHLRGRFCEGLKSCIEVSADFMDYSCTATLLYSHQFLMGGSENDS